MPLSDERKWHSRIFRNTAHCLDCSWSSRWCHWVRWSTADSQQAPDACQIAKRMIFRDIRFVWRSPTILQRPIAAVACDLSSGTISSTFHPVCQRWMVHKLLEWIWFIVCGVCGENDGIMESYCAGSCYCRKVPYRQWSICHRCTWDGCCHRT